MLYTHAWGAFFGVGAALAFVVVWRASDEPRALLRDAVLAFGAAARPVPALAADAPLPGDAHRLALGQRAQLRRPGPDLAQPDGRRPRDGRAGARVGARAGDDVHPQALAEPRVADPVGAADPARSARSGSAGSCRTSRPAWAYRYFAPILGSLLLLAALGMSRAKGRRPDRADPGDRVLGQPVRARRRSTRATCATSPASSGRSSTRATW